MRGSVQVDVLYARPSDPMEAKRMQDLQRPRVAVPGSGRGRGVLVVAAGAGAEGQAREACDRLARGGFVALPAVLADAAGAPGDGERAAIDAGIEQLFCEHATEGPRVGLVGFGAARCSRSMRPRAARAWRP